MGILLNLIEKSKEPKVSSDVVNYVTKKPRAIKSQRLKLKKSHENKVLETHKKRRKRKKLIQNLNRRRKPSHMQLYWEKRLERAPKNVLGESLFRDEIKKTTPPPSRKGGGEQYKPTTTPRTTR